MLHGLRVKNVRCKNACILIVVVVFVLSTTLIQVNTVRSQTEDDVFAVVWSPDGTMIAISGGEIGCDDSNIAGFAIRIYDATTNEVLKNLIGQTCTSTGLDWSPDGSHLVSFNSVQSVAYIWDVSTETLLKTVPLNTQGMSSVVWSPAGDLIASGTPGNSIILWDPISGQIMGSSVGGTSVDWNSDGTRLVTGSTYDDLIIIQDVATRQELMTLVGDNAFTHNVDWSPSGNWIVATGSDNIARVWDSRSGQLLLSLNVPNLTDARWSPDGQRLATTNLDGTIQVWDIATGYQLDSLNSSTVVFTVAWSPDGQKLAYFDKFNNSLQIVTPSLGDGDDEIMPTQSDDSAMPEFIWSIAWSPDGNTIAVGIGPEVCHQTNNDYSLRIVSALTGEVIDNLAYHDCAVTALDWNQDGSQLITTADIEGTAYVWEMATGQQLAHFYSISMPGFIDNIWNPNQLQVASISEAIREIILWNPTNGQIITSFDANFPRAVTWNPAGTRLATGGSNGNVRIWDTSTGQMVSSLLGQTHTVTTIAWSPDGSQIASAEVATNTINLWNSSTGQPLSTLQGHTETITRVVWSPDSTRLASASYDGTVRIWDVDTGQIIQIIEVGNSVFAVDWSPDGTQLAFGGAGDGALNIITPSSTTPTPPPTPVPTGSG